MLCGEKKHADSEICHSAVLSQVASPFSPVINRGPEIPGLRELMCRKKIKLKRNCGGQIPGLKFSAKAGIVFLF